MRAVLQRVERTALTADGIPNGEIEKGMLALVGIQSGDQDPKVMQYMLDKMVNLRIFEDQQGKMNLSIKDLDLPLFLVSNFTLYGDCRHGRRPGYSNGAPVAEARETYEKFVEFAKENGGVRIETGVFQAEMKIQTTLDGPVTLLLDSDRVF